MSTLRNVAVTLTATGILIAGLVFLFPDSAEAAQVTDLSSGALDNTGSFTLVGTIKIPAGERVPLDYARVLVASKTSTLAGGILSSPFCNAETGSTPSATIISVTGGTPTPGPLSGQGYVITGTDPGNGYSYGHNLGWGSHTEVFTGSGNGYGKSGEPVTIEITVKVTGCSFFLGGVTGATNAASETFRAQLFVGSSASNVIPSFPLDVLFANPNYMAAGPGTIQSDATGVTVVGGNLPKDVFTPVSNLATGSGIKSLSVKPVGTDLAQGSRISVVKDTDIDTSAPRFGVPNLLGQFPSSAPHMQFQFILTKPDGSTTTDLNGVVQLQTVIEVPQSYFQGLVTGNVFATEQFAVDAFKIFAYKDNGDLKPAGQHPVTTRLGAATNPYEFTVTVSHYSSWAAGSTAVGLPTAGNGGGGGGGGTETVTDTQTVTPITETTTTVDETVTETVGDSNTQSTNRTPGLAVGILAAALAAAAVIVRRRL